MEIVWMFFFFASGYAFYNKHSLRHLLVVPSRDTNSNGFSVVAVTFKRTGRTPFKISLETITKLKFCMWNTFAFPAWRQYPANPAREPGHQSQYRRWSRSDPSLPVTSRLSSHGLVSAWMAAGSFITCNSPAQWARRWPSEADPSLPHAPKGQSSLTLGWHNGVSWTNVVCVDLELVTVSDWRSANITCLMWHVAFVYHFRYKYS